MYQGDIRLGDTIDVKFTTVNTSGAPTTLAGTPVVSAYVGNGLTEITAGVTLTVDFDGRTGLHNVRVVASGANGFATATNVQLVITTGTVGGTSVVGYVVGSFSIENRSAVNPTTAGRTLAIDANGRVDLSAWLGGAVNALVSGRVDSSVGAMAAGVVTAAAIADAAFDRATFAADTGLQPLRSSTAAAGAAGTITLDASASAVDDFYNGAWIMLTGGTGVGQTRLVTDYVGATKVASISPNWATTPDATTTFAVLPSARVSVGAWLEAVVNALIAGRVDANAQVVGDKTGYAIGVGGIGATAYAAGANDAAALATDAVNEIRDAIFARAFAAAYNSHTFDELVKMMSAVLLGIASGMATGTGTFRNLADTGDVIVATQDADGNRTAVTRTP